MQRRRFLATTGAGLLSTSVAHSFTFSRPAIPVKVLVLNYDPIVKARENKRLHEVGRWQDPRKLAKDYHRDVEGCSHGRVTFTVVEWRDVDEYPAKIDGWAYTEDAYLECMKTNKGWRQPDTLDYEKVFATQKVPSRIDSGEIDEIWMFGAPYFGYGESAMAGPRAFYINGPTFEKTKCKRPFAIMGFNYERGVAEMIHNLCHRTESTMARVYGGWKSEKLDTNWARFAANAHQSNGVAGAGTCHYPPNGEKDYDYDNRRRVESDADDWLNYPNLTGKKKTVDCETWGGPDYHRNYMKWWFERLPHAPGINPDGRLNDWWEYVFNFDKYDEMGKVKASS
jgi:hypothetical protein